jgi:hypothetical protein
MKSAQNLGGLTLKKFPLACTESRFRILAYFGLRVSIDSGLEMSNRNCTKYQENAGLGWTSKT